MKIYEGKPMGDFDHEDWNAFHRDEYYRLRDREAQLVRAMTYARRLILNRNPSGAGEILDEALGE